MSFIQARPRATHDFYALVHKGLRLAICQMLVRLGACDGSDPDQTAALLADLRDQLHVAEHHLTNEDLFVHTALEERAPGAAAGLERDHQHHRHAFEELEALIAAAEAAAGPDRAAALHRLYLRFTRFASDDFAHMAEEEQLMMPILQSLFTDEELIEIETRIKATLSPEDMMKMARFMIPAAHHGQRVALLASVKAFAPPEAFMGLMQAAARPTLAERDYQRLCADLGVAA